AVRVRVRFFARYREATGRERLEIDLPEDGTVESAWSAVVHRHPELEAYRPFTLFAVGHDYVAPEHRLQAGDELCLFPPVSGGAGGDRYQVVTSPLSPDAAAAADVHPGDGGFVVFPCVVCNDTGGRHAMLTGGEHVLIGLSGGADSTALLSVLTSLTSAYRLRLSALHVDHRLRPDSWRDAEHVQALGARLGVPVDVIPVAVSSNGSLEDAARQARYAALERHANQIRADRLA